MEQKKAYYIDISNTNLRILNIISCLTIIVGVVECIWGVLQIFGAVPSGHRLFNVTGSFYNPGPFGCFLACILPMAINAYYEGKQKFAKTIYCLFFTLCIFLLPGGASRSGWFAAALGCIFVIYSTTSYKLNLRKAPFLTVLSSVLLLIIMIAIYLYKQDSADGRLFIWKVAAGYLDKIPLFGVGWHNVAGTYGIAQEAYFNMDCGSQREVFLADSPSYLYNEYLQMAFAFGIPSALLFISVLVFAFIIFYKNRQFGFAGSLLAFGICCMSSYPLQFWEFKLLLCLLVIASGLLVFNKIARTTLVILYALTSVLLLISLNNFDVNEQYDTAHKLSSIGQFDKANQIAKSLIKKSSSNELLMFIGDNYQRIGLRDSAEIYFKRAAIRVPNRLYPHYRLMKLYLAEFPDTTKARKEACKIIEMKPKVPSVAAMQIKQEAAKILNIPMNSQQIIMQDL